ncbi:glycoside hydrolase family 47 protein [Xylaria digitata]|nr:glycoside hydrolase family 47 protein [Xylaria digitata]
MVSSYADHGVKSYTSYQLPTMRRSHRKYRNVATLVAGTMFIWLTVTRLWTSSSSEFDDLKRYMNDRRSDQLQIASKSSFDWSRVPYRFPPGSLIPLPTGHPKAFPNVQSRPKASNAEHERVRESRLHEVKEIFIGDWKAYKKYAWLKDALMPISGGYRDQFSGWSATCVDSLDTLWILGLRDEFDEAVDAVAKIDFGQSTSPRVNTFETNIRYLGGLIAAYDLSKRDVLLAKAIELGDLIYAAFNTENRMPVDFIEFDEAKTGKGLTVEASVVSASPGTLSFELTRLSQITGDPKYYDAISRVMDVFYHGQNNTKIPGLWPTMVSMSSQDVVNGDQFTLAGCADSLYEYLPKMYALGGGLELKYEEMSTRFLEAAKALFFRPMIPNNEPILIPSSARVTDGGNLVLDQEAEHLGCYIGGVYALAGRLLNNQAYVNIGSKLTLGCVYGYRSFPTGIMPERLNMVACESFEKCEWDEKKFIEERSKQREWKEHLPLGFTTARDPRYILRPEAVESVFIMYRVTGKPIWQELGWDMFKSIVNGTRTSLGTHAAVQDVTHKAPTLPQDDYMESFWLAETLKYFYLLFSPPSIISLDDFVFNTEAHPFLRPK